MYVCSYLYIYIFIHIGIVLIWCWWICICASVYVYMCMCLYLCACNCRLKPPKEIFYRNSVTFMTVLPPPTMPKRCSCVYLCTGAKATIKCLSCAIYDPYRVGYFCDACFKVSNIGPYHYRFRCYYWHQVTFCLYFCVSLPFFLSTN